MNGYPSVNWQLSADDITALTATRSVLQNAYTVISEAGQLYKMMASYPENPGKVDGLLSQIEASVKTLDHLPGIHLA